MELATVILTIVAEVLKGVGDFATAKRVEEILKDRPKLSDVERRAFQRAKRRLGGGK